MYFNVKTLVHFPPTVYSWYDSSGRLIGPEHRPVPDNTQHSQETDIHAPGGIRNRSSKRAINDDYFLIQGVTGGMDQTSGECSLCYTIPI